MDLIFRPALCHNSFSKIELPNAQRGICMYKKVYCPNIRPIWGEATFNAYLKYISQTTTHGPSSHTYIWTFGQSGKLGTRTVPISHHIWKSWQNWRSNPLMMMMSSLPDVLSSNLKKSPLSRHWRWAVWSALSNYTEFFMLTIDQKFYLLRPDLTTMPFLRQLQ